MTTPDFSALASMVQDALRTSFTRLQEKHPDRSFYTFAIFTDDSLQFAYPVANTEEGLAATVRRYNEEVDPKHGTTSTRNGMRWAYGDWEFFPDVGEEDFEPINAVLSDNFCSEEEEFEEQIEPLWQAMLDGFLALEKEGYFGTGPTREKVTLLLVGHVDEEVADHWTETLNPPSVATRCLEWDCDAPDDPVT